MRLIDADALYNKFLERAWYDNADRDECACVDVDNAPIVDAVEVVRCKDCKHHREINEKERKHLYPDVLICTNAEFIGDGWNPVWPVDFCRYGERRDE